MPTRSREAFSSLAIMLLTNKSFVSVELTRIGRIPHWNVTADVLNDSARTKTGGLMTDNSAFTVISIDRVARIGRYVPVRATLPHCLFVFCGLG